MDAAGDGGCEGRRGIVPMLALSVYWFDVWALTPVFVFFLSLADPADHRAVEPDRHPHPHEQRFRWLPLLRPGTCIFNFYSTPEQACEQ